MIWARWAYKIRYLDKGALNPKTGKPRHRQEISDKRKHAESRLLVIQNEIAEGTHIALSAMRTVAEVAEIYLRNMEDKKNDGRIGESSLYDNKCAVNIYINPLLGSRPFDELTILDMESFYSGCMKLRGIAPTTARRMVCTLGRIQDYAARRGVIKSALLPTH